MFYIISFRGLGNNKKIIRKKKFSNKKLTSISVKTGFRILGITFNLIEKNVDLFKNGINQNTLYLVELLLNIGYDVIFILDDKKINEKTIQVLYDIFNDNTIKYTHTSLIHENYWFQDLPGTIFNLDKAIQVIEEMKLKFG